MYRKKFAAWGFEKYNKQRDMVEILQKIPKVYDQSSPQPGQLDPVFNVRGRTVTIDQVASYFRKKLAKTSSTALQASELRTVTYRFIEYQARDKNPQPSLNLPDSLKSIQIFLEASQDAQDWLQNHQLQRSKGDQALEPPEAEPVQTFRFDGELIRGLRMLKQGQAVAAGARIECAFRSIKPMLLYAQGDIISDYLVVLKKIGEMESTEIGPILIRYTYETVATVLGPAHALTRFFKTLMDHLDTPEILSKSSRICYETSSKGLGKLHPTTISNRTALVFILRSDFGAQEEFSLHCEELIQSAEISGQQPLAGFAKRVLSSYLIKAGQFQRGIAIIQELALTIFNKPPPPPENLGTCFTACQEYADYQMKKLKEDGVDDAKVYMAEYHSLEALLKACVEKSMAIFGPKHHNTLNTIQGLAEFYANFGPKEQSQVHFDYISTMMEEFKLQPE